MNYNLNHLVEIISSTPTNYDHSVGFHDIRPFNKLNNNLSNLEFMSYAPRVKEEYIDKLPSITHIDNTARLQTVTEKSHKHFYELLTEFGKISKTNVLLNTSFNIRGYPILSTIEDALYALENTKMDYVVIEDYLFEKQ